VRARGRLDTDSEIHRACLCLDWDRLHGPCECRRDPEPDGRHRVLKQIGLNRVEDFGSARFREFVEAPGKHARFNEYHVVILPRGGSNCHGETYTSATGREKG